MAASQIRRDEGTEITRVRRPREGTLTLTLTERDWDGGIPEIELSDVLEDEDLAELESGVLEALEPSRVVSLPPLPAPPLLAAPLPPPAPPPALALPWPLPPPSVPPPARLPTFLPPPTPPPAAALPSFPTASVPAISVHPTVMPPSYAPQSRPRPRYSAGVDSHAIARQARRQARSPSSFPSAPLPVTHTIPAPPPQKMPEPWAFAALGTVAGLIVFALVWTGAAPQPTNLAPQTLVVGAEQSPAAPRVETPRVEAVAVPAATEDSAPVDPMTLAVEPEPEPAAPPVSAQPASRSAMPPKPGGSGLGRSALLNLNSLPISNVVVNGRPVGSTPLVGFAVRPGTHSVTFVHPTLGRRSASVKLAAGQRRAVVVRFDPPVTLD